MVARLTEAEKRSRILDIFVKSKTFFTLKEIESIGYKSKGISQSTIKDILEMMVSDNIVVEYKVGTSKYYTALPSAQTHRKKQELNEVKCEKEKLETQLSNKTNELHKLRGERVQSSSVALLLNELQSINASIDGQRRRLKDISDCDPITYDEMESYRKELVVAINKITDNIFSLQSWVCNRCNISNLDFYSNFGLNEDFDYVV